MPEDWAKASFIYVPKGRELFNGWPLNQFARGVEIDFP